MWRLTLTKDKLLAPSHPWVQACCHLLQSLGVIILADQSITYYMLAPGTSHGHDFLCLLKARHITLQRGNTVHFQQAGSAAISNSTKWNIYKKKKKKKVISVRRKKIMLSVKSLLFSAFIWNEVYSKIRLLFLRMDVLAFAEGVLSLSVCLYCMCVFVSVERWSTLRWKPRETARRLGRDSRWC